MNKERIDRLYHGEMLSKSELINLIQMNQEDEISYLCRLANEKKEEVYGKSVYFRGLIEFTNYCKNDCLYCGIRCSNNKATRYRMSLNEILHSCEIGDTLGFQTYVTGWGRPLLYR